MTADKIDKLSTTKHPNNTHLLNTQFSSLAAEDFPERHNELLSTPLPILQKETKTFDANPLRLPALNMNSFDFKFRNFTCSGKFFSALLIFTNERVQTQNPALSAREMNE